MKYFLLVYIMLFTFSGMSQDMNGIWRGKLTQEPGGCFPEYFIELQIDVHERWIGGTSYDYYDTSRFVQLNFSGTLSGNSKRKMIITERKVLKERIPEDCVPCLKTYDLTYTRSNNDETLSGTWKGEDMGTVVGCPPGKIFIKRVKESAFAKKKERVSEIVRTLHLDTSNVKVEFYDNGQVDGDTISIFLNSELVLSRKRLSLTPLTLVIPLQPSKDYEMVMFAESLGTIPPNTALMIITSGSSKYEIFLSASENKNAAVKFRFEKK
ncbi:MAG: hypothetical protein WKF89_08265 [Chitinophagaceae bacterium]